MMCLLVVLSNHARLLWIKARLGFKEDLFDLLLGRRREVVALITEKVAARNGGIII